MTEEPENLTLKMLREMRSEMREGFEKAFGDIAELRTEMREGLSEIRAEQQSFARLLGKVSDAVTEVSNAVTEIAKVQEHHSELLEQVHKTQANHGARLNAIDGRLAIIEEHTGLVKA